jgi:hypothetical protein
VDLKVILWSNLIKDCPMVQTDLDLANKIFGKDIAVVKGKSVRSKPKQVIHDTIDVPIVLKEAQSHVTLCIDTFFLNKMAFFTPFRKKSTTGQHSGSQTWNLILTRSV